MSHDREWISRIRIGGLTAGCSRPADRGGFRACSLAFSVPFVVAPAGG